MNQGIREVDRPGSKVNREEGATIIETLLMVDGGAVGYIKPHEA